MVADSQDKRDEAPRAATRIGRRAPHGRNHVNRSYYARLQLEVVRLATLPPGEVEVLAHRPTTAETGSLERLRAYAARILCKEPLFQPGDGMADWFQRLAEHDGDDESTTFEDEFDERKKSS